MTRTEAELKSFINNDFLFANFSKVPEISDKIKKQNLLRVFTGGVRINKGMYRTQEETNEYIKKSLMRELP